MRHTELNQGGIGTLLERYRKILETAKVIPSNTLFEVKPVWDCILMDLCPFCGKKLKFSRVRPIVRCGRKKCVAEKPFLITSKKYAEIKAEVQESYDKRAKYRR